MIGATMYGNRGAEAMLSTLVWELRKSNSDLKFNVFSYYRNEDKSLNNQNFVSFYSSSPFYLVFVMGPLSIIYAILSALRLTKLLTIFPSSVRALARSKILICLAGVSFIDGRTKFLPFNVATILPAMFLGIPVIKFAQAMGPFKSRLNKLAANLILKRCKFIFARREESLSHLDSIFKHRYLHQHADDIAFLFKPIHCLSETECDVNSKMRQLRQISSPKKIVGICPSSVIVNQGPNNSEYYLSVISEFVRKILSSGHTVALFPNATRSNHPEKTHNNDLPLIRQLIESLKCDIQFEQLIVFNDPLNSKQIHQIIQKCDVLVTSRFHVMVSGLTSLKPVLVLGWSHKYLEVMKMFHQEDMVLDHTKATVTLINDMTNQLIQEQIKRSAEINQYLPEVQRSSKTQIDYVNKLIQ